MNAHAAILLQAGFLLGNSRYEVILWSRINLLDWDDVSECDSHCLPTILLLSSMP